MFKSVQVSSVLILGLVAVHPAAAQEIVAPLSAVIDSGGPGFGSITDTINQNGLLTTYAAGTTDFDSYIASDPQHSFVFSGNEWFSNLGSSSAIVTYDMGSIFTLDALALWNEEASGIGTLSLLGSSDGSVFNSLGVFGPANNVLNSNYGPEVFSFAPTSLRYLQFAMTDCPQGDPIFTACAVGEVAFRTTTDVNGAVPEPSTWAMMLLGFGAVGFGMRRRTQKLTVTYA
jgi:hypothetical protein